MSNIRAALAWQGGGVKDQPCQKTKTTRAVPAGPQFHPLVNGSDIIEITEDMTKDIFPVQTHCSQLGIGFSVQHFDLAHPASSRTRYVRRKNCEGISPNYA